MKVVICDDESCFVDRIKSEVSAFMKSKNIEARFRVYTGDISLDKIEPEHFDLAFLDIEMGDVCGTDIAAKLKKINPHIVIFIITYVIYFKKLSSSVRHVKPIRFYEF